MVNLKVERVSKLYGGFAALKEVDLDLGPGIWGLLGPNGAGKSTLMRILTDLLVPSTGRVLYNGRDIHALGEVYRDKLGYLPQDFGVYPNFTAEGFLHYIARLKGLDKAAAVRRAEELLELVGLADRRAGSWGAFPAGSGSGLASPRLCSTTRRCSSWTNPLPAWTPKSVFGSGHCSPACPGGGWCCCPPILSPMWNMLPTR